MRALRRPSRRLRTYLAIVLAAGLLSCFYVPGDQTLSTSHMPEPVKKAAKVVRFAGMVPLRVAGFAVKTPYRIAKFAIRTPFRVVGLALRVLGLDELGRRVLAKLPFDIVDQKAYAYLKDHIDQDWYLCELDNSAKEGERLRATRVHDGKTILGLRSSIIRPPQFQGRLMAAAIANNYTTIEQMLRTASQKRGTKEDSKYDINFKDPMGRTALFAAIRNGAADTAKLLIDHGADVMATQSQGANCLDVASQRGDPELVLLLLEAGANPNKPRTHSTDPSNLDVTPLYMAAQSGHLAVVEILLQNGADPNRPRTIIHPQFGRQDGGSPVYIASQFGYVEVVRALLKAGANPNQPILYGVGYKGSTALYIACYKAQLEVARLLLEYKADPNIAIKEGPTLWMSQRSSDKDMLNNPILTMTGTPLHCAAEMCQDSTLTQLLLSAGARVDAKDGSGITPLYFAAQAGHTEVVRALLDAGADPNLKAQLPEGTNHRHTTPLYVASQFGHTEIVKLLLSKGAKVNSQSAKGVSPLVMGALSKHTQVCKILLEHDADPNLPDMEGFTPLWAAVQIGAKDIIHLMRDRGADFNVCNPSRGGLVLAAVCEGNEDPDILHIVLSEGADPDYAPDQGITPLMICSNKGWQTSFEILLSAGANPDARDSTGSTALHYAAEKGHIGIVQSLIEAGVNTNVRDGDGRTPLSLAREAKRRDVVDILSQVR